MEFLTFNEDTPFEKKQTPRYKNHIVTVYIASWHQARVNSPYGGGKHTWILVFATLESVYDTHFQSVLRYHGKFG